MSSTRLLLVRHGETDDNHRGVFQGQSGRGLNARGREQATLLAARLAGAGVQLDALYCSDLDRARETAEILAAALSSTPIADPRLREVYLGAWQGLSEEEVRARFPDEWTTWRSGVDLRRGGGETYAELSERMHGALASIALAHPGGAALVVSHGGAIKAFIGRVLGLGVESLRRFRATTNTGVSLVERDDDGALRLLVYNDVAHLHDPLAKMLADAR